MSSLLLVLLTALPSLFKNPTTLRLENLALSPDFHFHVSFANLSNTFDAFMDEGWQALKALRRSTPHG